MKCRAFFILMMILGGTRCFYGEVLCNNGTVAQAVYGKVYEEMNNIVDEEIGETVYQAVYVDDQCGKDHFSRLNEAIKYVKEGGTIYLGKDIIVYKPMQFSKAIHIISFPLKGSHIEIKNKYDLLFKLEDAAYFKMEGVHISGLMKSSVITGHAEKIYIKDSEFFLCNPIIITRGKDYNIDMEGNTIIDGRIDINPSVGNNNIKLVNNTFKVKKNLNNAITFKNTNVYGYDNTIDCTSVVFKKGEAIEVDMQNNVFSGKEGKIFIKTDSDHIHFNRNQILKDFKDAIYYRGLGKADFTHNWWGSKTGASELIDKEHIDCRYWALFENFKRFEEDPYTLEDLGQACKEMGKTIDDENWIYNMKEDDRINLLDVIGVIREIE
ncbi:hypothetical protein [Marinisporobacter balticus]|uniref:Uncharacterized protein n=1 Tax=Marinisporobacter balticus TaxID=2018667 RepID=A0A4R2KXT5_9FIRM|nr:hypothetical protein [Marinisporobacter balticus]TCO78753.1 hypothetical protein EV214_104140 [Marinisporobacter balticus]